MELETNHFVFEARPGDFKLTFKPLCEVLYFGSTDYDEDDLPRVSGIEVVEELIALLEQAREGIT